MHMQKNWRPRVSIGSGPFLADAAERPGGPHGGPGGAEEVVPVAVEQAVGAEGGL